MKKFLRSGVSIPPGIFVPYNAQATLHSKEVFLKLGRNENDIFISSLLISNEFDKQAFFALLLPITVHGRVSDIWRSYISQVFNKTFPFKCCINHHCDGLSQSSWSMIITRGPKSYLTNFYPPASFHLGRCFCCLSSSFGEYIAMFLSLVFLSSSFCRAKYDVRYGKTAMCTTTWPTLTARFLST